MAKERIEICKDCELRRGYFCGVCWCELDALAELLPEEGGICKHPKANKWVGMHLNHAPAPKSCPVLKNQRPKS